MRPPTCFDGGPGGKRPFGPPKYGFEKKFSLGWVPVLEVLNYFNFVLGPPLPRGVLGEGADCHSPKEIVGFGPIPARIQGFLIFILALSTARLSGALCTFKIRF